MSVYTTYQTLINKLRNPKFLKTLLETVFDVSSGHDHDGSNSKAVSAGTVSDGAVTNAKLATDVKIGSLATLTTTETASVVGAVNELVTNQGTIASLTTTATDLVAAVNEHDAEIGDTSSMTTTATTVVTAINEIDADVTEVSTVAAQAQTDAAAAVAAAGAAVSATDTVTLTNKTLTSPKIVTTDSICDGGGDELLRFVEAATPVTYVQVTSGNTGVAPKVQGAGETNTDLHLQGSGTGNVKLSDGTDPTKLLVVELNGATTAKATTLAVSHTDDRTVTLPDATTTLVGHDATQTLSNKTLTAPKIVTTGAICDAGGDEYVKFVEATTPVTYAQITSGDTGVAPKVQGAGETNTDLHLLGSGTGNVKMSDGTDPTKLMVFELAGATTAKTATITSSHTDDRTITLPDATDTLVGKATTDTLTNKTLTAPKIATGGSICDAGGDEYVVFTEATTPVTYIGIVPGDTTVAPQVRGQGETNTGLLLAGTGTGNVQVADGADTTKVLAFELGAAATAKTMTVSSSHTNDRTLTLPDASDTLMGRDTTDTMTNKTLTSPVINTPVITNPATTVTLGAHDYGAAAVDWTLNAAELLLPVHKPTNANGACNAIVAVTIRPYLFINATGQALTVKTAAGSGIAIANTKSAFVMADGTNVIRLTTDA